MKGIVGVGSRIKHWQKCRATMIETTSDMGLIWCRMRARDFTKYILKSSRASGSEIIFLVTTRLTSASRFRKVIKEGKYHLEMWEFGLCGGFFGASKVWIVYPEMVFVYGCVAHCYLRFPEVEIKKRHRNSEDEHVLLQLSRLPHQPDL